MTLAALEDDDMEHRILLTLEEKMKEMGKEIVFDTHDDNVKMQAADQVKIENMYRNDLNREAALKDTRKLDDDDDPVSIDTVVADGEFVPPMPLAFVDSGCLSIPCVNFEWISKDDDGVINHAHGDMFAVFAPSRLAYAAIGGLHMEIWHLEISDDEFDASQYADDGWTKIAEVNLDKQSKMQQHGHVSIMKMTEVPNLFKDGNWSYKYRIVDSNGKIGPFSKPSATVMISETDLEDDNTCVVGRG